MRNTFRNGIISAAAVAALGSILPAAEASIVTLAGGAAGQGLTINPSSAVYAIYAGTNTNQTYAVQEVTFTSFLHASSPMSGLSQANDTYVADGSKDSPTNTFSDSDDAATDEQQLSNIMNAEIFFENGGTGELNFTLSTLADSQNYVVTLLYSLGGYPERDEFIAYNNGATADTLYMDNTTLSSYTGTNTGGFEDAIFETSDTVESSATGTISVQISEDPTVANGGQHPLFDAVIISTVPEPASLGLLGAGVIGLTLRRKRRRQCPA